MTIRDPPAGEIVGRNFDRHAVAFEDADAEAAKLPRDGGQHFGPVIERHPERGAWEHFCDGTFELDQIFLGDAVLRDTFKDLGQPEEALAQPLRLTNGGAGVQRAAEEYGGRRAWPYRPICSHRPREA